MPESTAGDEGDVPPSGQYSPDAGGGADRRPRVVRPEESAETSDDGSATKFIAPEAPKDGSGTEIIPPAGADGQMKMPEGTGIDSRVARLAVEMNLVNREAVRVCVNALEQVHRQGLRQSLAGMFVDQGLLSEEQAKTVLEAAAGEEAETPADTSEPAGRVDSPEADTPELPHGFEVLEKIGQSSTGAIYKARQMPIDRVVALKILPAELASDRAFVKRFVREARAAGRLSHPNIVRAFDVGRSRNQYYFAMEFVDGRSLGERLRREGSLPPAEAVDIVRQVARGLECAWQNGLVHRDINPDNILITNEGAAKLADLGLARQVTVAGGADVGYDDTHDETPVGTPHYVSPEQARGETVDVRTDIYSLGVTLYHAVTGELPFRGETVPAILAARLQERPRPANEVEPAVSPGLARIIDRMMAMRPEDRYPDPRALLDGLELLAEKPKVGRTGIPTPARPKRRVKASPLRALAARRRRAAVQTAVVGGLALVLALAGGAVLLGRMSTGEGGGRKARTKRSTALVAPDDQTARERAAPAPDEGPPGPAERVPDLEVEAAGLYHAALDAYEARAYDKVIEKIESAGAKYAGTTYQAKIEKLRSQAAAEAEASARRAAEEEREREYQGLLALARARLAAEDFDTAMKLLTDAGGLKEGKEVRKLLLEAERGASLALARKAEAQGAVTAALGHYADALKLRDDPGLRRHVADLDRRARRDRFLDQGREAETRGEHKRAVASYREALKLGGDPKLWERVQQLEIEMRLARPIAEAKAAESRGDLAVAVSHYQNALRLKEDARLRRRVEELGRKLRIAEAVDQAKTAAQRGEWASTVVAYRRALDHASDRERKPILKDLEAAERELAYTHAVADARTAADAEAWEDVRTHACSALAVKPGDAVAEALVKQAFRALGPERMIAGKLGTEFVLIPAGEFTMGTTRGGDADERPARRADLPAFYMSKCETTNAEFEAFDPLRRSERKPYSPLGDSPVIGVTLQEAMAFCRWLSRKEGVEYRLPTEEEWEKAARGTDGRTYPWGDEAPGAGEMHRCNFAPSKARGSWKRDGFEFAAPAGSYSEGASPYGCLDMAGNVWEWCLEGGSFSNKAKPTERGVLRGGSFSNGARDLRSSNRAVVRPDFEGPNVGFRCVRTVRAPEQMAERAKPSQ